MINMNKKLVKSRCTPHWHELVEGKTSYACLKIGNDNAAV